MLRHNSSGIKKDKKHENDPKETTSNYLGKPTMGNNIKTVFCIFLSSGGPRIWTRAVVPNQTYAITS